MQRIDKTNDGPSNKTLNNVHSMSKMAFAVKRLIKSSVLHDDKCRGVIIDHIEGSDDTLKVFIPSTEVDTELLKSKLALCRFSCRDIKIEGTGTSCKVSRMNERKALLRELRAVIRRRLGEPDNIELVAITAFSKSRKRIEITIRRSVIDEEIFLKFLDALYLLPIKIDRRNEGIVFLCKISDYDDFECSFAGAYWLEPPIGSFEDVKSFVLSRWDDPDWRVEMAPSEDKNKAYYVFVLVSSIRRSDMEAYEALRIAERKLNLTINARYGGFSLRGYIRNSETSHHTISACYYVGRSLFTDGWAPAAHIRDCELDSE